MKLNLKDWNKISQADDHTVLRNKDGHETKIIHKPLSKQMRKHLHDLPMLMSDGGMVEEKKKLIDDTAEVAKDQVSLSENALDKNAPVNPVMPAPEAPKEAPNFSIANAIDPRGYAVDDLRAQAPQSNMIPQPQAAAPEMPQATQAPEAAAPVQQTAPMPAEAPTEAPKAPQNDIMQQAAGLSLASQQQGLGLEAAAIQESARAQQRLQQNEEQSSRVAAESYQRKLDELETARKFHTEALAQQKIDPQHYWNSKSTGSKVASMIGLILGGAGGGLMHQENPVLKMMNQEIDRDVDAQKAELGKTENLLAANMRQFGNLNDATKMTQIMQTDILAHQLGQIAAKTTDKMAQARLLQAQGQLLDAKLPGMQQLALNHSVNQMLSEAQGDPGKMEGAIEALRRVDPKRADDIASRYVPGMGLTLTPKGKDIVTELKASVDTATDGLDELLKINKIQGKSLSLEDRAKAETIAQSLIGILRVPMTGPGAMNDGERKMLEKMVANPASIFSIDSVTKTRLNALKSRLATNLKFTARANGIRGAEGVELTPQQKTWVAWARKNPNDPRSTALLQKLGL